MAAVRTEATDGVLEIVLDRPDALNAMNQELFEDLSAAVEQAGDPAIRAVLVRGQGRGFCAGGDIRMFAELIAKDQPIPLEFPDFLHDIIERICALPKPVLAAVHGPCAGAGFSLMLACDLAIAAQSATFPLAYSRIGLSPDGSSSFFLPRHLGSKRAMELFLFSDRLDAEEALALGLINRVVPEDELLSRGRQLARALAAGPTQAFGRLKKLVQVAHGNSLHEQLALESQYIHESSKTADFRTGVTAFLGKQKPVFTGE